MNRTGVNGGGGEGKQWRKTHLGKEFLRTSSQNYRGQGGRGRGSAKRENVKFKENELWVSESYNAQLSNKKRGCRGEDLIT